MEVYTVKVEESRPAAGDKPSAGPVYRCIYAKDGLLELAAGGRVALGVLQDGPYVWQTYEEAHDKAIRIGSAIRSCGVNPGDHCGIYGSNCPEWVIAMEACNAHGIPYVPLYDTLGAHAVEFIINHAEVSIAFVQENKIQSILTCLPSCATYLKTIVSFGKVTSEQKIEAEEAGVSCFSWAEFASIGTLNRRLPQKKRTDICTIMYTSGTTGDPKGVILTNEAIMAEFMTTEHLLLETDKVVTEEDTYFSFLPLAHVFDQIIENYCISKGASIGFWRGVRKLQNLKKGLKQDQASPFFDKLIFNKIKQSLGGRVRIMLSGAAPLPRHVEEFLRVTSCSILLQGYGLTESSAGCFTSIANVFSMIGTVGVPVTTIEARLESVPDMGYDALSTVPRGEICLRGTTLFSGYHKRPDLTDDVLVDGWFHTGDIGEWQTNGAMKIIDRKKNIFKLSQGEYIAVENVESTYSRCPLLTSIWVYGNSFESFLVGVVVPDKKCIEVWASANDVTGDFKSLCEHPKARKYMLEELNNTGRKHELRGFEMLKAIHLEPIPFDMERDLITPTFKLKRPQLLKYYKDCIDQLYREAKGQKA
ncbi:Long chain acyl-CoA synthetase 2 [Acorus calamus]|uniref:4-coumarate--CoA ligase n=1 Tax=Acorus calamus TaxID=4465 RepID=A0AAV9FHM6_ACOCL|nr:Long chain acyl-CoA synthetase 2 [Acorus calamus]